VVALAAGDEHATDPVDCAHRRVAVLLLRGVCGTGRRSPPAHSRRTGGVVRAVVTEEAAAGERGPRESEHRRRPEYDANPRCTEAHHIEDLLLGGAQASAMGLRRRLASAETTCPMRPRS